MKKILKGCLLTIAIIFGILSIVCITIFIYWQSPNNIKFSHNPIKKEKYLNSLSFDKRQVPGFILKLNERNILYQAYIEDDDFMEKTVIYKVVVKVTKAIELKIHCPLTLQIKKK